MPISSSDLQEVSKIALDEYMRNIPVDQVATDRPLLKMLLKGRKTFLGARQNIVENVRTNYSSNFSWAHGETPVSFNKRHTTEQAAYPWRRAVDGLYLDHDRLFHAGIKVREGERGAYKLEQNEKVQLLNLMDEQMHVLREGFMEKLDMELHRMGIHSADAISGLDAIISTTPTAGTVGGINAATATYWRNHAKTGIAPANLAREMEIAWRACIRSAGAPNFILAGSDFIDAYRSQANLTLNANSAGAKTVDLSVGSGISTGLYFKNVEILWSPQFETLQAIESAPVDWNKRCYFINTKHLKLRDDDMDIVTPVRPHNTLAMYVMVNLRIALTCSQRNAHAVLAIA